MSRSRRAWVCWLAVLAATVALGACGDPRPAATPGQKVLVFEGSTMGTTYTVKVVAPTLSEAERAATGEAIRGALDAVDGSMSTYKPDSELSRFNRYGDGRPFKLSVETIRVFLLAREVSAATGGAFDVTVGPLVNAWGFGPVNRAEPPTEAELEAVRARVGYQKLAIDAQALTVTKGYPDMYVDLSAIAKGFGVDQVAAALDARGLANYMVEVGGEVRVKGHNAAGVPWQVGIERPDSTTRQANIVVPMSNRSMATSGDYRPRAIRSGTASLRSPLSLRNARSPMPMRRVCWCSAPSAATRLPWRRASPRTLSFAHRMAASASGRPRRSPASTAVREKGYSSWTSAFSPPFS